MSYRGLRGVLDLSARGFKVAWIEDSGCRRNTLIFTMKDGGERNKQKGILVPKFSFCCSTQITLLLTRSPHYSSKFQYKKNWLNIKHQMLHDFAY